MNPIAEALTGSIASGIASIIKLFKVDPTLALQSQTELEKIQLQMVADAANAAAAQVQGQLAINQAEASSGDKFTSRARPTIMYICGAALFSNYVLSPFVTWASALYGSKATFPTLDMSVMLPILLGMLGLGGLHAYENIQGGK